MRRAIIMVVVGSVLLCDLIVWWASYRVATAPPPEALRQIASITPTPSSSVVEPKGDGFSHHVSLNGIWLYRQTGSEMPGSTTEATLTTANYASPELDVSGWHTMEIPRNWYLAGLNYHGVIWFRREFVADEAWRGRVVRLRFDGVDYFADVWFNGQKLGRHEGYFEPFTFDISDLVNYGGRNVIAVRVESPYEEYGAVWPHRKTLIKGVFQHHNTRPGNPWGPSGQEYNTGGIWADVWLDINDFVTVETVRLHAMWPEEINSGLSDQVQVDARVMLRNHADEPVRATVRLTLLPRNFMGPELNLPAWTLPLPRGEIQVVITGTVQNPQLWWPWDRGQPNLYTARVTVSTDIGVLATYETPFGFRQVRVGPDWTWTLNGQRFFPRGTNYISSQWLSLTNRQWFERDLRLIRDANLNFVRLTAHVEPMEFYTIADEQGILVWQEFPLQWGYSDAPSFVDEAQRQMRAMIELLYNHPSIVAWCVHNEAPWDTPALASRMSNYDRNQNRRLDQLLRDLARRLDPTRFVHINSGGSDKHVYPGWDSGSWRDYAGAEVGSDKSLPGAPFVTEYGAQALPSLETLQEMLTPEELTYAPGEVRSRWEFHGFQPRQAFDIAGIPEVSSTEELIAASQAYQAHLLQFATEAYRRAKYNPMQGIFQYMFADSWPAISWSVVDFGRRPKAGYYALQIAMQPVLPSIQALLPTKMDGRRWVYMAPLSPIFTLWVVNDTLNDYPNAQLQWQIIREDIGVSALHDSKVIHIQPDSAQPWVTLTKLNLAPGRYWLDVELNQEDGALLGYNQLEFEIGDGSQLVYTFTSYQNFGVMHSHKTGREWRLLGRFTRFFNAKHTYYPEINFEASKSVNPFLPENEPSPKSELKKGNRRGEDVQL